MDKNQQQFQYMLSLLSHFMHPTPVNAHIRVGACFISMVTVPDGAIAMTAGSAKAAADLLMFRGRFPDVTQSAQCFAVVVSGRADGIYVLSQTQFSNSQLLGTKSFYPELVGY